MRARRGGTLLEAMLALAILGVAGASYLALTAQAGASFGRVIDVDRHVQAASNFMEVVSLWPREDLDRRLGSRPQGRWILRIERESPGLYVAVLLDSVTNAPVLGTVLFRPEIER